MRAGESWDVAIALNSVVANSVASDTDGQRSVKLVTPCVNNHIHSVMFTLHACRSDPIWLRYGRITAEFQPIIDSMLPGLPTVHMCSTQMMFYAYNMLYG